MRAELAALPPKQKTSFSTREAIAELATEIRDARQKLGYSLTDIAALLMQLGHPIEASTLRSYVRESDAATGKKKAASSRKGKARMPLLDLSSEVQARRAQSEASSVAKAITSGQPPAPRPMGRRTWSMARALNSHPACQEGRPLPWTVHGMARAGDGAPRSSARRTTAMISLRLTEDERGAVQRKADAAGYASVSEFVRDRILRDGSMSLADVRMIGNLARIGGWLTDAADALDEAGSPQKEADVFRLRSRVVHGMQIELFEGDDALLEDDDLLDDDEDMLEVDDAG